MRASGDPRRQDEREGHGDVSALCDWPVVVAWPAAGIAASVGLRI